MINFDLGKSLQELEGVDWGEPDWQSGLVLECHRLRRVPLCEFTIENLRIMIGQNIGLECLIPLALERLRKDPLAEGDCSPGDLLANVLRADATFWKAHPNLVNAARDIAKYAMSLLLEMPESDRHGEKVTEAYREFEKRVG